MREKRDRNEAGGRDREVHQSREYSQDTGREYGHSRQRYEYRFEEDEKRKKKRNKMARYLLGTVQARPSSSERQGMRSAGCCIDGGRESVSAGSAAGI